MRLASIILLLCWCFLQCKGAPPKGVAKTRARGVNYTDKEDNLIVEELSRLSVDKQEIFSMAIWENIADKHREQWRQGAARFPQERSAISLKNRLIHLAKTNHPLLSSKLPEKVFKAIGLDLNKSLQATRPSYTDEEEEFIVDELSKPSCLYPFATATLEDLRRKHEEKSQAKIRGFENERTVKGLSRHITRMNRKGRLPHEVAIKVGTYSKVSGAGRSKATSSNQQADLEDMDEEEEEDDDEDEC